MNTLNRKTRREYNRQGGMNATTVKALVSKEVSDLRAEFEARSRAMVRDTVQIMLIATATVLHDKWGFGHDRLRRMLDQIDALSDSMTEDRASIEDFQKVLLEETGINLPFGTSKTNGGEHTHD